MRDVSMSDPGGFQAPEGPFAEMTRTEILSVSIGMEKGATVNRTAIYSVHLHHDLESCRCPDRCYDMIHTNGLRVHPGLGAAEDNRTDAFKGTMNQ
jgi:hypothetical protein